MGEVIKVVELAKASRARLARRITEIVRRMQPGDKQQVTQDMVEIGRLIHEEAGLAYSRLETPAALLSSPAMHVLAAMRKENPELKIEPRDLLDCVQAWLQRLQAVPARA